jgi:hypothetical protein
VRISPGDPELPLPPTLSFAEAPPLPDLIAYAEKIASNLDPIGAYPEFLPAIPLFSELPAEAFDAAAVLCAKVDTKGRISVRQSFYSVPVGLARRRVSVRLGAQTLEVVADGRVVASHVRSLHKGTEDLVLDHYLEILVRKPGALPGSTALAQARASGSFSATHERFWAEARRKLGDGAGTRALIGVVLLQRRMATDTVIAAMRAALSVGSVDAEVVAIEARRLADRCRPAPVVPIGTGARDVRPVPRLDGYDALLAAGGAS